MPIPQGHEPILVLAIITLYKNCTYTLEKTEGENQEWTIQRHWQNRAQKKQDEDKLSTKTQHNTENCADEQNGSHQNTRLL